MEVPVHVPIRRNQSAVMYSICLIRVSDLSLWEIILAFHFISMIFYLDLWNSSDDVVSFFFFILFKHLGLYHIRISERRHNIAEILLMLALNTNQSINQSINLISVKYFPSAK